MIIDDNMTVAVTIDSQTENSDVIDFGAEGTDMTGLPPYVMRVKTPGTIAASGVVKLMTCATEGGDYVEIARASFAANALTTKGKKAVVDMPKEGLKRYAKFSFALDAAPAEGATAAVVEMLLVPNVDRGL